MKKKSPFHIASLLCLALLGCYGSPLVAAPEKHNTSADKQAIHKLITAMNQAVTQGDLDALLATLDDNALKVSLFPAHYPSNKKTTVAKNKPTQILPKTENLKQRWKIALRILSGLAGYQRKATDMVVQIDRSMATAWVDITSKTTIKNGTPEIQNHFVEMVLLKKTGDQWKILLTSNNRHDL